MPAISNAGAVNSDYRVIRGSAVFLGEKHPYIFSAYFASASTAIPSPQVVTLQMKSGPIKVTVRRADEPDAIRTLSNQWEVLDLLKPEQEPMPPHKPNPKVKITMGTGQPKLDDKVEDVIVRPDGHGGWLWVMARRS